MALITNWSINSAKTNFSSRTSRQAYDIMNEWMFVKLNQIFWDWMCSEIDISQSASGTKAMK